LGGLGLSVRINLLLGFAGRLVTAVHARAVVLGFGNAWLVGVGQAPGGLVSEHLAAPVWRATV